MSKPSAEHRWLRSGNEKGMVLIMTFIIMAVVTVIAAGFLYMTSIQTKALGYDVDDAKALWLAEAGLQKAFYTLNNDAGYQSSPTTISGTLASGTYSVTCAKNSNMYTFTSTGTVGIMVRKITHSMALTSSTLVRAIHADGASLDFLDSTGAVNGNVSCKVQVKNYSGMTISGTITSPFPMINPTIDFDYYKTLAQAAGQYTAGAKTFTAGTYSGVWYVGGQATIDSGAVINGSVIGDNNISFEKAASGVQITPSPLTNYPALAAKNNISTSASGGGGDKIGLKDSVINGMVLAQANITFNWIVNSTVNGTILAGNNITMSNGTGITLNYDANIFAPMTPGFTYSAGGTSAIVSQKDWNEIAPT